MIPDAVPSWDNPTEREISGGRKSRYLNAWATFTGVISVEFAIFISELLPACVPCAPCDVQREQRGDSGNTPCPFPAWNQWHQIPNRYQWTSEIPVIVCSLDSVLSTAHTVWKGQRNSNFLRFGPAGLFSTREKPQNSWGLCSRGMWGSGHCFPSQRGSSQ